MAAQVGKYAANTLLKKQMKNYKGKKVETGDDPYFAMIEDPRRPGKYKKVKKQVPAYIPEHDATILASVRKSAYRLDMCLFNFLGIRFGWEAVVGLVPLAGDAIGVFFALLVVRKCANVDGGLATSVKLRMLINIALDFLVGLVPFLGDLADAAFKCNTRNLRLLEITLDKKYRPQHYQRHDHRDEAGVDGEKRRKNRQSGIYLPNDPPPATAFEDFSEEDEEDERRGAVRREHDRPTDERVRRPEPAHQGRSWAKWANWGGTSRNDDAAAAPVGTNKKSSRPAKGAEMAQV